MFCTKCREIRFLGANAQIGQSSYQLFFCWPERGGLKICRRSPCAVCCCGETAKHEFEDVTKRSDIEKALRQLAPEIPDYEASAIADHAMDSRGLNSASPQSAAWLSMVAFIRHALTEYDSLLEEGYDRESARHFVAADIQAVLMEWGVRRLLSPQD
jgi:hypothetical protein